LAAAAGAPLTERRVTYQLWGVAQARPLGHSLVPEAAASRVV